MINKKEISVGSLIQLSNGDILRLRSIDTARDIVALEYESRAAGDLPPAESASHLRLNAPDLPPAVVGKKEVEQKAEPLEPVVFCKWVDLASAVKLA